MKKSICALAVVLFGANASYAIDTALESLKTSVPPSVVSETVLPGVSKGDAAVKEVIGSKQEKATLTYGISYSMNSYKPSRLVNLKGFRLELNRPLVYNGSPITALCVIGEQPESQRFLSVPCSPATGVCEVAADMNFYLGDGFQDKLTMTIIYNGKPIIDSYDGKPYFILSGF